ncbi:methyltransferase domain-containing protein [Rubrobacter marinus]|uniref:Methyltransferase domain-containing protein n=1 Tax=Rubrobacter marinus TaxID=2653852 RepID=A0A6G8Q1K0_9ACTN|nr:methyltransferase domain-containing protein [Rubrobacter marinus]QIN80346.1 methyltransferase domain-containing protein [Rubrobacter marinus]
MRSPGNGRPLTPAGPATLTDGERLWPVVGGIPYLRAGRDELVGFACRALERGDERAALVELLRDQDDWAPDPPPGRAAVEALVDGEPGLREAMDGLGFGPVGDYFTYRLSDPTYLAGLALIQAHWNAPQSSFELACGIGHYSRDLSRRGVATAGGDVVFAKLWLARRYVAPATRFVCFDAAYPFPVASASADLALCQDAFYFLPEKAHVAEELLRVSEGGTVAIGHAHNAAAENHSSGAPLTVEGYAALLPDPLLYDDAELTQAFVSGEPLVPRPAGELGGSEAVCLVSGAHGSADGPDLTLPPPGTPLLPNPLYEVSGEDPVAMRLEWPSPRYEDEYAPRSGYLPEGLEVSRAVLDRAARGAVGADPEVDRLARVRVLLDLPGRAR